MEKFLKKLIKLSLPFLISLFITVTLYINADPYSDFTKDKVAWKYRFQQLGDLNTKNLINSSINYNSFILGSSRSLTLKSCYLQENIKNSFFFHYASWVEKIEGIYYKLKLLDSRGYHLDNVIIYLDTDCTFLNKGKFDNNDHYLLTNKTKFASYYKHFKMFFKNFDSDRFKILINQKPSNKIITNSVVDPNTNDQHICKNVIMSNYGVINNKIERKNKIDSLILSGTFYKRESNQTYLENQISPEKILFLKKIKELLIKHKSKYKIFITPLYDQKKFSRADIEILSTFFSDNLYDLSGINEFTNDIYNYNYDVVHFHSIISRKICDSIILKK